MKRRRNSIPRSRERGSSGDACRSFREVATMYRQSHPTERMSLRWAATVCDGAILKIWNAAIREPELREILIEENPR